MAGSSAAAPGAASSSPAAPAPEPPKTVGEFFGRTRPILDYRLRYELVDQQGPLPVVDHAHAVTSRLRAGFETAPLLDTRLLAEGEWSLAVVEHYNDTTNDEVWYPVVADPETIELNRLQLANASIPQTTVTLGRQRITLDDQRFFGNVGWRQNEQTMDSLRVENKSVRDLTINAAYVIQVNRVFGNRSRQQDEDGDTAALHFAYPTPLGTLSMFGYWVEFESRDQFSSQTYGLRFAGKKSFEPVIAHYAASYAVQADAYDYRAAAPLTGDDYVAHYFLGEAAVEWKGLRGGLSYEYLGADDGDQAFQTPLATLHKFQGWTDKFLTTPGNGVADLYIPIQYLFGDAGMLEKITAQAIYHTFDSAAGDMDYGDEIDVQLATTIKGVTVTLKYADYFADEFATDTRKAWVSFEYVL